MFGSFTVRAIGASVATNSVLTLIDPRYCVGTRRQALLNQEQIDHCIRLINSDNITNYESRMVAEVNLYWIIYRNSCASNVNLSEVKHALQTWRRDWTTLFGKSFLLRGRPSILNPSRATTLTIPPNGLSLRASAGLRSVPEVPHKDTKQPSRC